MKKITIKLFSVLCLISTFSFGQMYTTELFNIVDFSGTTNDFNAQIDINITTDIVTLTLIGPDSEGWFSMGFDSFGHDNADVVTFDGTNLLDSEFTGGFGQPTTDTQQNWTTPTISVSSGVRTVVSTRARVSPDASDYVFSAAPEMTTINVVGGYNSTFDIGNKHDEKDFASPTFSEVLGIDELNRINFSMSPNPATDNLRIVLPSNLQNASIEIYDMLARKIYDGKMNNTHYSIINVSSWTSGVYLVRVSKDNSTQTKRFIKQ